MRTTIDLPDDLHRAITLIARDRNQTLSRTVASLIRSALADEPDGATIVIDPETGLPTVHVEGPVTPADVAAADEDG
jgi:hypothetical protein